MARVRDYAAEYERRIDLARERFPDAPRSEVIAHARGHRSTADLETVLTSRKADFVDVMPGPRSGDGRWRWVDVKVEMRDGTTRTYRLQGEQATAANLGKVSKRLGRKGVDVAGINYLRGRRAGRKAA